MDQKRPYNDIPDGDSTPVPPVSGDTMPLPSPETDAPAPDGEKAEKTPPKKAKHGRRALFSSRKARTALAVGDAAVSTVAGMVRFILRLVLSVLLVLLLGGLLFACIFAYYVKNSLTTDLNITLEDYAISL